MAKIEIERQHSLGKQAARESVDGLAQKLSERQGLACRWDGDVMLMERSGVDGRIEVGEDRVRVEVTLGLLLAPMSGLLKQEIEKALDKRLA